LSKLPKRPVSGNTGAQESLNNLTKQAVLAPPAGRRVALVIGNGAYQDAPALANPPNDARAVAVSLRRLGFDVMEGIDLNRSGMEDALLAFAREAEAADDALVFYAGHGIQVDGRNYLLPIDVRLNDVRDLRRYLTADQVISDAAGAQRFALVILDACRDNPFVRSLAQRRGRQAVAVGRGLAKPSFAPPNTLIAYATAADEVAADAVTAGDGITPHSPFTAALLRYLEEPGLEVGLLFRRVRDAVVDVTLGQQVPFTYGSLGGTEIYLAGAGG
jgi:uncharacterized caspase-like protein